MGRTLEQVIAALPGERRARIEARHQELTNEVESLGELRRVAGKAQVEIASALNIKQPSVSKIEKQADMYLSTLRSYVQAIGGELELLVKLPARDSVRLHSLGDIASNTVKKPRRASTARQGGPVKRAAKARSPGAIGSCHPRPEGA